MTQKPREWLAAPWLRLGLFQRVLQPQTCVVRIL